MVVTLYIVQRKCRGGESKNRRGVEDDGHLTRRLSASLREKFLRQQTSLAATASDEILHPLDRGATAHDAQFSVYEA